MEKKNIVYELDKGVVDDILETLKEYDAVCLYGGVNEQGEWNLDPIALYMFWLGNLIALHTRRIFVPLTSVPPLGMERSIEDLLGETEDEVLRKIALPDDFAGKFTIKRMDTTSIAIMGID